MASLLKRVQQKTRQSLSTVKLKAGEQLGKAATKFTEEQQPKPPIDYDKYLELGVILEGKLWKRRSGMGGKSRTRAWELRRVELRGSALLYYDDTESTSPPQPRGMLDLVEENARVQASLGHQSGAPSPFCLSIVVHEQTKWKLCMEDQSKLMLWLAALTNVVVQSSVDAYNVQLLHAANPNNGVNAMKPKVYEPTESKSNDNASTLQSHHQLWLTEEYTIRSTGETVNCGAVAETSHIEAQELERLQRRHQLELQQRDVAYRHQLQDLQEKIVQLTVTAAEAKAKHNKEVRELQQEVRDFARIAGGGSSKPVHQDSDDEEEQENSDDEDEENYHDDDDFSE